MINFYMSHIAEDLRRKSTHSHAKLLILSSMIEVDRGSSRARHDDGGDSMVGVMQRRDSQNVFTIPSLIDEQCQKGLIDADLYGSS